MPFDLFPQNLEDILIVLSIVSALYLAWLFGYREKTVIWLAYVSFFQVVGLSLVRENYTLMTQFIPPLLMTVLLIWLFESPVEKRTKEIEENRERLEEELSRNQEELSRLTEQINLLKELTEGLSKEKEAIERQLEKLKEEESIERQNLEREKEEPYMLPVYQKHPYPSKLFIYGGYLSKEWVVGYNQSAPINIG